MKEAWDKDDVGTKNIPHPKIYWKVFFSEF
jgi:hypothetical protein